MMQPDFQPIPHGSMRHQFLTHNGLDGNWPHYHAEQLQGKIVDELAKITSGQEPNDGRYDLDTRQPSEGHTQHLASWGNGLRRGGVGSVDLGSPQSITIGRMIAAELAEQSATTETLHTLAGQRMTEARQRRLEIRMLNNGSLNPSTHIIQQALTIDHAAESSYSAVRQNARALADQRQMSPGSIVRSDPHLYDAYGFALPEAPLTPIVVAECREALDAPVVEHPRPATATDTRIAHVEQAHQMAHYGAALEQLLGTYRMQYGVVMALYTATRVARDAHQAATERAAIPTSDIARQQQKLIGAYRKVAITVSEAVDAVIQTGEEHLAKRYALARAHIALGKDQHLQLTPEDIPLRKLHDLLHA